MPRSEQQPVGKKIPDGGGMDPFKLAADLNVLGHPVALRIVKKLLEHEPSPEIKKTEGAAK